MTRIVNWFRDLAFTVREIAKAVAHARTHPSEPPKHEDK